MVYITQLIYIKEGQEDVFHEFEDVAIPAISKYNGLLLFRLRPSVSDFVTISIQPPYEIHFIQFDGEAALAHFMNDEERNRVLHLKEQSIQSVLLVKGAVWGG